MPKFALFQQQEKELLQEIREVCHFPTSFFFKKSHKPTPGDRVSAELLWLLTVPEPLKLLRKCLFPDAHLNA